MRMIGNRLWLVVAVAAMVIGSLLYFSLQRTGPESDSTRFEPTPEDATALDHRTESDASLEGEATEAFPENGYLPSDLNPAFRSLSPAEMSVVDVPLREKYWRNGDPTGYRRHAMYYIDTAMLRLQLEASTVGGVLPEAEVVPTTIPLFEEFAVTATIDTWTPGGFGVVAADGSASTSSGESSVARFVFDDSGQLRGSVMTRDTAYLISNIQDNVYYVVMELDIPNRID